MNRQAYAAAAGRGINDSKDMKRSFPRDKNNDEGVNNDISVAADLDSKEPSSPEAATSPCWRCVPVDDFSQQIATDSF